MPTRIPHHALGVARTYPLHQSVHTADHPESGRMPKLIAESASR